MWKFLNFMAQRFTRICVGFSGLKLELQKEKERDLVAERKKTVGVLTHLLNISLYNLKTNFLGYLGLIL